MLDLLELIGGIGELVFSWRFFISVAAAGIIIAAVCWTVDDQFIRLVASIAIAVVGSIGGFVWQTRND